MLISSFQRERAWAVHQYPCIGRYRFLTFPLQEHRLYESHVLKTLKQEPLPQNDEPLPAPLYLELGVCFGQEIRALLHAGVPSSRLYAADVEPAFIPMGYDLFRDEDKFPPSHQIAPVDALDLDNFQPDGRLGKFLGKVDILHLSAVFHLFDYEKQVALGRNLLPLMRRGGVILGCHMGHVRPTEYPRDNGGIIFRHNAESWEEIWMTKVTENGLVTDPRTVVQGAKLRVSSELISISQRDMPRCITSEKDKGAPDWRNDEGGRWMRFDVWVGEAES